MPIIRIPLNYAVSHDTLNKIAFDCGDFNEFLEALKKIPPESIRVVFDEVHKKKIKRFYDHSLPIKIKNFISKHIRDSKYFIPEKKIYAGVYTITGFIKYGNELYVRTEMPEDTAILFGELRMDSDQWKFFYVQVRKTFNL